MLAIDNQDIYTNGCQQGEMQMFGYNVYDVIKHNNDVGIITALEHGKFKIMFETAGRGVEFVWYPLSFVSKYQVIG